MADINVERRGPRIWPWIIGVIILVLLIWAIAEIVDREEVPDREVIEVVPRTNEVVPPVQPPGATEAIPGPGGTAPGTAPAPGTGNMPGTAPPPDATNPGGNPSGTTPNPGR